jgi:hypothetical protein
VTHLRRIMLEELQRRHYSQATTQRYIRFIERFAQHFHCSPDPYRPRSEDQNRFSKLPVSALVTFVS